MIEINNLNELIEAIGKYSVPQHVIIDVDNRIKDWLISGGNESDNYILNQCKYVERIINYKIKEECNNGKYMGRV